MSFYDYDYSDYTNSNHQNTPNPLNEMHYSNFPTHFQAKNQSPVHHNQKFDYGNIVQQNKDKRQQQLNELRLNHARKNASMAARFNMPNMTHRITV